LEQWSFSLDDHSRGAVGRFVIKLAMSALLAAYSKPDYVLATTAWIGLYAVLTSACALILKERFHEKYSIIGVKHCG
jgi:hypothetical protein